MADRAVPWRVSPLIDPRERELRRMADSPVMELEYTPPRWLRRRVVRAFVQGFASGVLALLVIAIFVGIWMETP